MYILTIAGKEKDGAFSVRDEFGEHILYLFEEEDDAIRFALMLEDDGAPEMHIIEVDAEVIIKTCEMHEHSYIVITPNDVVIPPIEHDYI